MFEMLTGKQRTRGSVLRGLNPKVPPEVDDIIGRMLAANVSSRAQSAATIAAELRSIAAILDTRAEVEEAAFTVPRARSDRGRAIAVRTVLVVTGIALLLAVWLWWVHPWR
jgi:hypothetical protein